MFLLRSNGYSLRGHLKVVLPRPTSSYMQHSFTYQAGKQWNNLPDKIRMSESLSIFRKNLQNIQLSSSYDCNCVFCKQTIFSLFKLLLFFSSFNFSISYFLFIFLFITLHVDYVNYHVVIFMALLHLNELSLICNMWLNKITYLQV